MVWLEWESHHFLLVVGGCYKTILAERGIESMTARMMYSPATGASIVELL